MVEPGRPPNRATKLGKSPENPWAGCLCNPGSTLGSRASIRPSAALRRSLERLDLSSQRPECVRPILHDHETSGVSNDVARVSSEPPRCIFRYTRFIGLRVKTRKRLGAAPAAFNSGSPNSHRQLHSNSRGQDLLNLQPQCTCGQSRQRSRFLYLSFVTGLLVGVEGLCLVRQLVMLEQVHAHNPFAEIVVSLSGCARNTDLSLLISKVILSVPKSLRWRRIRSAREIYPRSASGRGGHLGLMHRLVGANVLLSWRLPTLTTSGGRDSKAGRIQEG